MVSTGKWYRQYLICMTMHCTVSNYYVIICMRCFCAKSEPDKVKTYLPCSSQFIWMTELFISKNYKGLYLLDRYINTIFWVIVIEKFVWEVMCCCIQMLRMAEYKKESLASLNTSYYYCNQILILINRVESKVLKIFTSPC